MRKVPCRASVAESPPTPSPTMALADCTQDFNFDGDGWDECDGDELASISTRQSLSALKSTPWKHFQPPIVPKPAPPAPAATWASSVLATSPPAPLASSLPLSTSGKTVGRVDGGLTAREATLLKPACQKGQVVSSRVS